MNPHGTKIRIFLKPCCKRQFFNVNQQLTPRTVTFILKNTCLKHLKNTTLKKKDKENVLQNAVTQIMICVDLQKCLPTPVLTNSQSFCSLKLWTYNYTLYNATNKKVTCMMCDEPKSGRGANEMPSGMLKWALATIKPQHEEIFIWSDNCPSQNRNIVMVMAYFWILKIFPTLKCLLYYKTDFDCPEFQKVNLKRTGRRIVFLEEFTSIRCELNPISTEKFKHLQKLLRWIPKQFHDYYRDLVHQNTKASQGEEEADYD
ncbi:hypothetical protein RN001_008933 [Aquatica leii]|uniref:Uncharacterized protein n=1 Tax=Aquatica leii TaxID=1421715 RepID=A0AAN7SH57_9COLE|nr:hypothetical protein RN001_008933 [Aquatica leii]